MTAQIADVVLRNDTEYSIAGISGGPLFLPADFGIETRSNFSPCWRGHVCHYRVTDDGHLQLHRFHLMPDPKFPPPTVFGRRPAQTGRAFHVYDNLAHPVPFTGGLLLGRDSVRELYVHMGFHPAWKFREVHELLFDAGRLTASHDRSAAAEEFRQRLSSSDLRPDNPADRQQVEDWIAQCFSLQYRRY